MLGSGAEARDDIKREFQELKKQGLVEGRYPNIFVSFKVADIVGTESCVCPE